MIKSVFPGAELISPRTVVSSPSCIKLYYTATTTGIHSSRANINIRFVDAESGRLVSEYNFPVFISSGVQTLQVEIGPTDSSVYMLTSVTGQLPNEHSEVSIDKVETREGHCSSLGMLLFIGILGIYIYRSCFATKCSVSLLKDIKMLNLFLGHFSSVLTWKVIP